MKALPFFIFALFLNNFAHADLADSCSITNQTSCVLNNDLGYAEFLVTLPNYSYCGVKFLSDTYPNAAVLEDFAAGLYVTAGPRWDLTAEQTGYVEGNLVYPVGSDQLFATFFDVYTRVGCSLNDYIHAKLATTYRPNPTVSLVAVDCY